MPQTSNRPGAADPRPIIQNHAGGEISVSPTLPHRSDNAFDRLLDRLDGVRRNGRTATARCPAHEDHSPSLSLRAIEGQTLAYCFAGCDAPDVMAALNMTMADLYDEPRGATYRYDDGRIVHRTPNKKFSQSGNTKGPAQLYRAPAIAEAVRNGTPVYLVEGEKDVHALESLGVVATTAPMGASNWSKVDPTPLYGGTIVAVPDADDAGQRWAEDVRASLAGKVDSLQFMAPKVGKDVADHIAAGHALSELVSIEPPERYNLVRASEVVPETMTWLWEGYIPAGKITLVDGDPGEGKSTLTLDIAARVSRGGPMPDRSAGGSGTVLIMSAEDGVADTIVPRLSAAGANLRRVHILTEVRGVSDDGKIVTRPVELPGDLPIVERIIREHRVVLVVIDPLMAYLSGTVNSFRDQDVRRALHPLAQLAETTGATFVVVRHLNKSAGGKAMYRGGGSIGIGGAARVCVPGRA